MHGQQQRKKQ